MAEFWQGLCEDFSQSFLVNDRWKQYLIGLGVAGEVTLGALILGVVLGVLVAVVRTLNDQKRPQERSGVLKFFNFLCKVYTTIIRGTPMMVQLLIMGFVIFASSRELVLVAILSFGINSGAYVSEIIRAGIMSVDRGQMEAGRSLGMGYAPVMRHIVIPQAIKNILPSLGNELITLFKETSIVTVIGLRDLTKVAIQIQAKTYQAFMPFIGIALMYLAVVLVLTWLLGILERRLRAGDKR